ncbi:FkbM family methyltransferase [Bradyrhizobium sp. USDA 336]|uniref:FkbM family methyltransferase n=1 Tax=Bradyrhizobium sp. USDA 336 TaxID=3156311 RepID=UPI0038386C9A
MNLFLIRARKVLHSLRSRPGRRALQLGVGPSVEHEEAFRGKRYATLVDLGANKGQFALFARGMFPGIRIESFEPIPACCSVYLEIFDGDSGARIHQTAIGPQNSKSSMFITVQNDSSSLLQPGEMQRAIFQTHVAEKQEITISTLERVLTPQEITRPALLKIDVQGYELEALKGCQSMLSLFDDAYVEASFVELYKGQALVPAIIDFFFHQGFHLRGVFNQHVDRKRGPVQADFLFSRIGETKVD